jgi:hypothetical protein
MIIHNVEECEKWINSREYYPFLTKVMLFEPKNEKRHFLTWHVADIIGKSFQHDLDRIELNINTIANNYPQLQKLLETLHIFICPKPSANTSNACANDEFICYFARSTQIPWCMTDYITGHELGHVIEFALCSNRNKKSKFKEYLELRNAEKGMCHVYIDWDEKKEENIYEDREDFLYLYGTQEEKAKYKEWDSNPQEWFAEDFRWFFGTDQGDKFWGHPIPRPDNRIKEFMLSL